jgi:death-on-curing protein
MSEYLTKVEVLAIHQEQIERFGGSHGLRDEGALEAALFRPQTGYYADLIEEAAALWESLSQNHAFVDGNKRTALDATDTFLTMNGARLNASPEDLIIFVTSLYEAHNFRFDLLVPWLRQYVTLPPTH